MSPSVSPGRCRGTSPGRRQLQGGSCDWVAIMGHRIGQVNPDEHHRLPDQPTAGSYKLDDLEVASMNDEQLAGVRNRKIGFVFQTFNLLSRTSALANVELPLVYAGKKDRRERATAALERVAWRPPASPAQRAVGRHSSAWRSRGR